MTKQSEAGSASATETVGLPAGLAELARLKARAAGMNLEDYVRALVAADAGSRLVKSS